MIFLLVDNRLGSAPYIEAIFYLIVRWAVFPKRYWISLIEAYELKSGLSKKYVKFLRSVMRVSLSATQERTLIQISYENIKDLGWNYLSLSTKYFI